MFVRSDVRVSGGLRPLRGHAAPQRPQPGRHARCETEMFGPWTRYCKRRGKGGLKRRIMGRFFCRLYAGGRQKRWPPQTGGGQPSADGSGLPRPSAKRFLLPAVEEFRPDGARFVWPHKRGFPFAADRRLGARAGASTRRRGPFPYAKVAAGFVGGYEDRIEKPPDLC